MPNHQTTSSAYMMIDVSQKASTFRSALAEGKIIVGKTVYEHIVNKTLPKGNALKMAEMAGIMGAKKTHDLIPLCHILNLDQVSVHHRMNEDDYSITVYCLVKAVAKTGVEMEALMGVNLALLTLYDLCKMVEANLTIARQRLLIKCGGKSKRWEHPDGVPADAALLLPPIAGPNLHQKTAVVITVSERAFKGNYRAKGLLATQILLKAGMQVSQHYTLPDDLDQITLLVKKIMQDSPPDLLITVGGTGVAIDDVTPEAIRPLLHRELQGISEYFHQYGALSNVFSWLSRSVAGLIDKTVVVAMPGSEGSIQQNLDVLLPLLPHLFHILAGGKHPELEAALGEIHV